MTKYRRPRQPQKWRSTQQTTDDLDHRMLAQRDPAAPDRDRERAEHPTAGNAKPPIRRTPREHRDQPIDEPSQRGVPAGSTPILRPDHAGNAAPIRPGGVFQTQDHQHETQPQNPNPHRRPPAPCPQSPDRDHQRNRNDHVKIAKIGERTQRGVGQGQSLRTPPPSGSICPRASDRNPG